MLGVSEKVIDRIVERALEEDLGEQGDLTSEIVFGEEHRSEGVFISRSEGVLAGGFLVERIFRALDDRLRVKRLLPDGTPLSPGRIFCSVQGPTAPLLTAERTILNFIQRMSGIATLTKAFKDRISNFPHVRIADTRKTTPGLRVLEKYAVRVGGGSNHRFGLFDAVMIKDNHIAAAGGIADAVRKVRNSVGHTVKVEVEVTNMAEAREAADAGADIVMLDNMDLQEMKDCVGAIGDRVQVEASGGITLETVGRVVKTGVHVISVGALTHSAPALDLSFELTSADDGSRRQ